MTSQLAFGLVAVATLATTSSAMPQLGGAYSTQGGTTTLTRIFVDPQSGVDPATIVSTSGTNPATPLRTVAAAVATVALNPGSPATINIADRVITATTEGSATISLPAFGINLETWKDSTSFPSFSANPGAASLNGVQILVDRVGDITQPPTKIENLNFFGIASGIVISPDTMGSNPNEMMATEVRGCLFSSNAEGIRIGTALGWTSQYVVENNTFRGSGIFNGQSRFGVIEVNDGAASTLYRCNDFSCYEENLAILNGALMQEACRPRIMSNFFQLGEFNVNLMQCDSLFANNTTAFSIPHITANPSTPLRVVGGRVETSNNIIWKPAGNHAGNPIEISQGAVRIARNDLVGGDPAAGPLFEGGDNYPATLCNSPVDMHLTQGSAAIDAGDNRQVMAMTFPFSPSLPDIPILGRQTLAGAARYDVSMDIDADPRVLLGPGRLSGTISVDQGADEFSSVGVSMPPRPMTAVPNFHDQLGNIRPVSTTATTSSYLVSLPVTGTPGDTWSLMFCLGYEPLTVDPRTGLTVQDGSLYHQIWTGSGNLLVNEAPGLSPVLATGTFDAMGDATATVSLPNLPIAYADSEFFLQVVTQNFTTGQISLSNRLRIELNQ